MKIVRPLFGLFIFSKNNKIQRGRVAKKKFHKKRKQSFWGKYERINKRAKEKKTTEQNFHVRFNENTIQKCG